MTERLSRVYLDNYPVTLMGDEAAPPLSRIVRAGGKRPDYVDVLLLASPSDMEGRPLAPEEVIDRSAEPTRPIYLRTIPHDVKPIYTARPGPDLPRLQERKSVAPASAKPDRDPVIEQLGARPVGDRPPHKKGVFRSPSQLPPEPDAEPLGIGARTRKRPAKAPASLAIRRAEAQAMAEAEAEQRQEDERNQEDALQDEAEAAEEADEDGER